MVPDHARAVAYDLMSNWEYRLHTVVTAQYVGRLVRLQLKYYSEERQERSGIAIKIDPALTEEANKKHIQLAIDTLDRHIKERENALSSYQAGG